MALIKYFSTRPETKTITGGQVYDNMMLDAVRECQNIDIKYVCMPILNNKLLKIAAPLIYLCKGIAEARRADIIIFNSSTFTKFLPLVIFLSKVFHKNIMMVHHHFLHMQMTGFKRAIFKKCEFIFLKCANKVVIPSPYIYGEMTDFIPETRLLLWRIPFESKVMYPSHPMVGNLTYTGTIEERKGIIYLLESMEILKKRGMNFQLTIIGKVVDDVYYRNLSKFIKDKDLNVKFTGFISKEEKEMILSQTDVFVFPSLLEGFGMVLVEAQSYALPIVCFDNSAMPFSVKDNENGFTVETKNSLEFANAIQRIVSDRQLRNNFGISARNNALEQPSVKSFSQEVTKYFKSIFR